MDKLEENPYNGNLNAPVHSVWCTCHLCTDWLDRQQKATARDVKSGKAGITRSASFSIFDCVTHERVSDRSYPTAEEANHDYHMNGGQTYVGTVNPPATIKFVAIGPATPWEYRGPCQCGAGIGGHGAATGTCPNGKTVYRPRETDWKPAREWSGSGLTITEATPAEATEGLGAAMPTADLPTTDYPLAGLLTETRLTWRDAWMMAVWSGVVVGVLSLVVIGAGTVVRWCLK